MKDQVTIRTSIQPNLKRHLLLRGSILAFIGIALLLYAGVFLGVQTLTNWGTVIWLISILLIALGLIPYRRVTKIEENPNQLVITDDNQIHYYRQGRPVFTFPIDSIQEVHFVQDMGLYGMAITLKEEQRDLIPNPPTSVVMQIFEWSLKQRHSFDRFFPFFSERGTRKLREFIH